LKSFNERTLNTLVLRNWTSLALVSHVLTLFISLFYFELSTSFATLTVIGLFILSDVKLLKSSIRFQNFHFHPFLIQNRLAEVFIGLFVLLFYMMKSFIIIGFISIIQRVFFKDQGSYVSSILDSHFLISASAIILAVFFMVGMTANAFEKHGGYAINTQRQKIIDTYRLDHKDTYSFFINNKVIGFMVGKHSFEVDLGLKVGRRKYKPATVLDYLNIAGIGFKDLDDGHIKNIEMYSIGS
jgi:hypothetical protein